MIPQNQGIGTKKPESIAMWQLSKEKTSPMSSSPKEKKWGYSSLIYRSWWVFLCFALCFFCYSHAIKKKTTAYFNLREKLQKLQWEKALSLQDQEDLLLQINSHNDPSWIEMTLMKRLGVVPEGQVKVYFKKEE